MGRILAIFLSVLTWHHASASPDEKGSGIASAHDIQPTENVTIYERENTTEANESQHGIHLAALNIEHVESKIQYMTYERV